MAKNNKGKTNAITDDTATAKEIRVPDFAKSRTLKKQLSVLAKLADWQRKSAETDWVIGEYLSG
jgi:hypothetical protein